MPSTVWIQFVKMPQLGKVKTRLAATIGDQAALDAHKQLALAVNTQLSNYICANHSNREHSLWLALGGAGGYVSHADYLHGLEAYRHLGLGFQEAFMQDGKGLGDRMYMALGLALEVADQAFIVGSDFPVLDNEYLASAVDALACADVVLGATEDGGYGLIGVKQLEPGGQSVGLPFDGFGDVCWGTNRVCQQTQNAMHAKGLEVALLAKRFDVDEDEDWRRWQASAWNI